MVYRVMPLAHLLGGSNADKALRRGPQPPVSGDRQGVRDGSPEGSRPFGKVRPQRGRWEFATQTAIPCMGNQSAVKWVASFCRPFHGGQICHDPSADDERRMPNGKRGKVRGWRSAESAEAQPTGNRTFEQRRYRPRAKGTGLSVSMEHARKYHYIEHNPARDVITKFGKQGKTPDPYTVEQMQQFMSNVIGTEWEMPVVLAGMYGLRMSEIIGLRTFNIDLEKMQFGVVEQMPFKVPPGTKTITEMAPTKSNDRILPITEETLPYFLRQFDLIERQKALIEASGGVYYDNKLFIAKPDGSPQRRDRMSANFGQLIRHLEMPHIRFHDLRHTAATNMHQLTGDFYTVGEILGHTLKGIGMSLGISTNLEAVTAQYVNVRLERKKAVLETYHKALHPQKPTPDKGSEPKKAKKKSSEIEL